MREQKHKLFFGRGGRTVDYEDAFGKFTFVFDADPNDPDDRRPKGAKEKVLVERIPLKNDHIWKCQTEVEQERLKVMRDRVAQYLLSLGYEPTFVTWT